MMLNIILIKIANSENILSKNNEDKSAPLDESFISKFPITNAEGLLLEEPCILNEHSFVSKLVNYLFSNVFAYKYNTCIDIITNDNSIISL